MRFFSFIPVAATDFMCLYFINSHLHVFALFVSQSLYLLLLQLRYIYADLKVKWLIAFAALYCLVLIFIR